MTRASGSKGKAREIIRGSGNVFADLGLPDAEERQTKLRLAHALNASLRAKKATAYQVGTITEDDKYGDDPA